MTNGGIVGETSKHVGSFMDSLKREPLSLALVMMNLALLLFFYVLLTRVADQRKEEIGLLYADKKDVRELLAKCIVPGNTGLPGNRAELPPLNLWPPLPRERPPEAQ